MITMRALFGEGIGFATPIDSVKNALPNLLKRKKVPHAYLGLKMQTLSPELAESVGLPSRQEGVFLQGVAPRSPAEQAGLRAGDLIIEVDGRRVRRLDEVQNRVRVAAVGAKLSMKLKRGEKGLAATLVTADVRKLKEGVQKQKKAAAAASGPNTILMVP